MRIRRVQVVSFVVAIAVGVVVGWIRWALGGDERAVILTGGGAAVATAFGSILGVVAVRRAALRRAWARDDETAAREAFARYRDLFATRVLGHTEAHLLLFEATLLVREQRWGDAATLLGRLDERNLHRAELRLLSLVRGWIEAKIGDPARAFALAEQVATDARLPSDRDAAAVLRGIALLHLGSHEEAAATLGALAARTPRASILFHHAEALRRLGRDGEALELFRRAAAIPGDGGWQRRAREVVAELGTRAGPFR